MKYQIRFSGENTKNYFKITSAEIFTQHAKHYRKTFKSIICTKGNGVKTIKYGPCNKKRDILGH